jgi:signal transduction histidine kinase
MKKESIVEYIEFRFADKWGNWHEIESTANIAKDLGGEEYDVVFISRDITKRKQVERALQDAYFELKETQRQLVQSDKLAAVGQLAGGIAHEVKNPLGTILLCINDLEMNLDKEKRSGILKIMKKSVMKADKLVRNLLTFSRPVPLELRACRINEIIKSALELIEKQLSLKNIKVNRHFGSKLPLILVDQNQIEQVFLNILLNALQAMAKGGMIDITTSAREFTEVSYGVGRRATDVFRVGETALVIEVKDNGPGISKDILGKVFDPFFTTRPPWEGTGLGLTTARAIIERHKGLITIESEEDKGTTVVVMLPKFREEA